MPNYMMGPNGYLMPSLVNDPYEEYKLKYGKDINGNGLPAYRTYSGRGDVGMPAPVQSNAPQGKPNPFGNTTYSPEMQGKPNPFGNTTYSPMQFEAYPEPARVNATTPPPPAPSELPQLPQGESGLSLLDLVTGMGGKPAQEQKRFNQGDVLMALGSGMLGLSADPNLQKLGMAGFGQVDKRRTTRQAEAKAKDMANRTGQWLQANKRPDLAAAVVGGFLEPKDAITMAMEKSDLPPRVQEAMFYMNNPEIANRMKELGFIGGSKTNVNIAGSYDTGPIPAGYRLVYDDQGRPASMEKIEGGPAATSEGARVAQGGNTAGFVIDKIDRLNTLITKEQTWYDPIFGPQGVIAQYIPSSNRVDAQNLTDTIIANIGFDKLNQLREASPTGGALGQVTELELRMLQRTIASLSLAQSQDQFLQNLEEVKDYYEKIMRKALAYPNAAEFGFTGGSSSNNGEPLTDPAGIFR